MYTAFPTATSDSTDAAADARKSSYDPIANSIRNAFIRILAKTLTYHSSFRTVLKQQQKYRQQNSHASLMIKRLTKIQ